MSATAAAVEQALVSRELVELRQATERMGDLLERHETTELRVLAGIDRLVELEEHRAAREERLAQEESDRRRAADTLEAKRLEAEITEHAANRSWLRQQATPIFASLAGLLGVVATALGTWVAGWWGGSSSGGHP